MCMRLSSFPLARRTMGSYNNKRRIKLSPLQSRHTHTSASPITKSPSLMILSRFARYLAVAMIFPFIYLEICLIQASYSDAEIQKELASLLPAGGWGAKKEETQLSNDNYKLSNEQSLGFFDDISEENWIRAQQIHAKLFPNHYSNDMLKYSNGPDDKRHKNKLKQSKDWNAENFQEEFHCPLAQRIPTDSQGDGPKWVCDPHRLKQKKDCLVYSVGSAGKAQFEKAIKEEIGDNCEVHTFDVIGSNKRNGVFSKALKGYATFHQWGIGTEEQARDDSKRFKTLQGTMKELGHTNRTIDIFKIDCEWCEWFTFRQWLREDLRQILVETHSAPLPNAKDFFYELHDAGYVIFSKEANYLSGAEGVEFAFLKLSTEFFINGSTYAQSR